MIDDEEAALAHLYAMWVAPQRAGDGRGARARRSRVIAWAGERGARTLTTSVTEGKRRAPPSTRTGFADTGRREPLGHSDAVVPYSNARSATASSAAAAEHRGGSLSSGAFSPGQNPVTARKALGAGAIDRRARDLEGHALAPPRRR